MIGADAAYSRSRPRATVRRALGLYVVRCRPGHHASVVHSSANHHPARCEAAWRHVAMRFSLGKFEPETLPGTIAVLHCYWNY